MRILAELGAHHGLGVQACLDGTGLRAGDLADPAATVWPEQEIRLIRNLVTRLGHVPALGIEAGLRYHFTAFGMLGFAMASSENVLRALELALRYFNLTFALTSFRVRRTDADLGIVVDGSALPTDVRRFVVERDCAALVCVQRDLAPNSPSAHELRFAFPPPADRKPYEVLLGTAPSFSAGANRVGIARSALLRTLPQANREACLAAEAQCRLLMDQRRRRPGLAPRIRERLARDSATMPGIADVARSLGVTPRTLRRRLDEEGTTFVTLRDEVRLALAETLLGTTALPVQEIAARLGYAGPTSFINAFKRWKGTTPLSFRRRTLGAASS